MAIERWKKTGRTYKPKASIWKRGQIGLNNDALKEFGIKKAEKPWYVICFYDSETKKIHFQFTQDSNEEDIVKISFRTGGATLSVKSFLEFFNIPHSENKRYDIVKEGDYYIIDLKEGDEKKP